MEGLAGGLRNVLIYSLRADKRPGTEGATLAWAFAWASGTPPLASEELSAFYDISSEALAC